MKMKMQLQIVSKGNVKPSSPTPTHLRSFKLSLLDQLIPSPYAPIILFYLMNNDVPDVSRRLELLKISLSETLTRFYPLAGKIRDELYIDCDDEGAYYVETKVHCHLDEFLSQPDLLTLLQQFLPCELIVKESTAGTYVANFQVNVFECGGIAVGVCISHRILDGAALSTFLKSWTAGARGSKEAHEIVCPEFIASSIFPTNDLWLRDSSIVMWGSIFKKGKCITRRFVFDASAISNLKAQVVAVKCPTRVEVVSAFLWKCIMAASEEICGVQKPSLLSHLVNLRKRAEPPMSENSMGNLLWITAAQYTAKSKPELNDLVGEVRKSISKIDDGFVKKLNGNEGNSVMSETIKEIGVFGSKEAADCLSFSSWCKLGFYEADFGWGKPVWVSSYGLVSAVFLNLVILVDTRFGDGIEAWVTLDEQDMAILEANPEVLKSANLDPNPLEIVESVLHA